MLKPPDPYLGIKSGCGCLVAGFFILVIIRVGIMFSESKHEIAARRPVWTMKTLAQQMASARARDPADSLADLVAAQKANWPHGQRDAEVISRITLHPIPPEERLGFLEKVDYYLQYENTGVLSNGETFQLPYDAAALQARKK